MAKIALTAPVIVANDSREVRCSRVSACDLLDGLFVPLSLTVGWIGTLLFLFGGTEVARRTKLATTYAGPDRPLGPPGTVKFNVTTDSGEMPASVNRRGLSFVDNQTPSHEACIHKNVER